MANIKSQKKRVLTNEKRRLRSKEYRTALKTYSSGSTLQLPAMTTLWPRPSSGMRPCARQAVSKGILHANNAANKKSSMANRLNAR